MSVATTTVPWLAVKCVCVGDGTAQPLGSCQRRPGLTSHVGDWLGCAANVPRPRAGITAPRTQEHGDKSANSGVGTKHPWQPLPSLHRQSERHRCYSPLPQEFHTGFRCETTTICHGDVRIAGVQG